jgi:hypothetical protein
MFNRGTRNNSRNGESTGELMMALADYRLCDACGRKTFYDANLNYNFDELFPDGSPKLDYLGDWCVICEDCAKTYECKIVKRYVKGLK